MSSTFTSRLKLERQASGANSGNWGNLVNYVLNRIDSSVRGYVAVNVAGSANVTLVSNNSTSNTDDSTTDDQVHNKVIEFTGALGANINVFTDAVEGEYILFNNTTGSYTLTFGNTGHAANGVAITQGTKSIVYTNGSTIYDVGADLGAVGVNSLTSTGNVNLTAASSLVLQDTTGGQFAALKANGTTTSYTLTLPPATGSADQIIKTDGSGNLSFADMEAGINWQTGSIKTGTFTAAAGEGYFVNTSGGVSTANLPAGSAGAIIAFADYSRSFNTNNLTIEPDGSEKIGGVAAELVLSVNGQALTLVYVDATQGWINVQNAEDTETGTPPFLQATGGTITEDGDFKIHTFTGPGTFQVTKLATQSPAPVYNIVSYAVAAGGGGSGGTINNIHTSGGGGGGGFREGKNAPVDSYTASPLNAPAGIPVSVTSYPITVGAGASGGTGPTAGAQGASSVFGPITSAGGGGGGAIGTPGAPSCRAGQPGGSGGGGSSQTGGPGGSGNTPPTSPPQGNNGAAGVDSPPDVRAGSGGGATAAGTNGSPPFNQAAGAAGATTNISGSPLGYSGGGGAGGVPGSGPGPSKAGGAASPCGSGAAGAPGSGPFSPSPSTNDGADNRGGGAGGIGADTSAPPSNTGGTGGSGVVIIRYKFK